MICTNCKSPALLSCPCAKVSYCGKECQLSDWKRHKQDCPPFIVKEAPGKGRGLFATRSLPLGFTVLTEQPVLVMNPKKPDYDKLLTDFKSKNKEIQVEILKLRDNPKNCAEAEEEIVHKKVARIFGVNGMIKCLDGKDVSRNLYLKASLLNHSCSPNVVLWHTRSSVQTIKGKLLRKVAKGEELTICYYNESFADENCCLTKEQRKEKLVKYGFECQCDDCKEENIEDVNLKKEFQQMRTYKQLNGEMFMILLGAKLSGFEKCQQQFEDLLEIAKRKVELAKIVDSHAVFSSLVLCWNLSKCIAAGKKDQQAGEQATQYKKEVDVWAQILGPDAVEMKMEIEGSFKKMFE